MSISARFVTRRLVVAAGLLSFLSVITYGQVIDSVVDTVLMPIKVRDFADAGPYHHPDFENTPFDTESYNLVGAHKGYIQKKIGIKDDSTSFAGDERGPMLDSLYNATAAHGPICTSPTTFSDWYNDRDSTVNRSFMVNLKFLQHASGLLTYISPTFFPLDKDSAKVSIYTPPWSTFEDVDPPSYAPYGWTNPGHNYGFTDELHCTFTYIQGKNQTFKFFGDDDVWVFINDSLVVDIGGVHGEISDSVNLDSLPPGFLKTGTLYPFDFFHAERHVEGSQVEITTSIALHPRVRTMVLKAEVRDQNDTLTASDFERNSEINTIKNEPQPLKGMVAPELDTVNRVPVETPLALTHPDEYQSTATFYNWYHDADTNTNRPFHYDIVMQEVSPGIYGINWTQYFPVDPDSNWVPWNPNGPSPFGPQQTTDIWGANPSNAWVASHNWGFTTVIHSMITYTKGSNQFFIFGGDDDLWAFINDSLVMDMGGIHGILFDTLYLDSLPSGFLQDGQQYNFDLFNAERLMVGSDLIMMTNFRLDTYDQAGVTSQVSFANNADYSDATALGTFSFTSDTLWIQVYDNPTPTNQVIISINAPNGDKEDVILKSTTSKGTYRGYVVRGPSTDVTINDGLLGLAVGQKFTDSYTPVQDSVGTKLIAPLNLARRNMFHFSGDRVFAPTSGTLTLLLPNGETIARMSLSAGAFCQIPAAAMNKVVLYSWKSGTMVKNGRLTINR